MFVGWSAPGLSHCVEWSLMRLSWVGDESSAVDSTLGTATTAQADPAETVSGFRPTDRGWWPSAGRAKTSARWKRCQVCHAVRAGFEPLCGMGPDLAFLGWAVSLRPPTTSWVQSQRLKPIPLRRYQAFALPIGAKLPDKIREQACLFANPSRDLPK